MISNDNTSFNNAQREAIHFYKGPALVLAGPGSGKTTVLTHRVKFLIEEYGVRPSDILVITFTKAAATQMKQRFLSLIGESGVSVTFGTFHAIFFTILKHAYHYSASCIVTPKLQNDIIKNELSVLELELEDEDSAIDMIKSEISHVKNERLNIDEYEAYSCPVNSFRRIYRNYNNIITKKRMIDFDDMIVMCLDLFEKREDYRQAWQKKYQFILIDEFQDINRSQYDVVRILSEKHKNLFVVGDDDQSIYGFRGSKPDIMLNFSNDYKDCRRINLNVNYRSTKNIVIASRILIDNNTNRYSKDIETYNDEGEAIDIYEFPTLEEEKVFLRKEIKRLIDNKVAYSDIAVLSRTNVISGVFFNYMNNSGFPCDSVIQSQHFYDHWICKDIIAYIKIALGARERITFLQVINKPMRYITRSYLTSPVSFDNLRSIYMNNKEMLERINDLEFDLNMIKKMTPLAALNYIRKGVGYDDYIEEYIRSHQANRDEILGVLDELQSEAKKHKTLSMWLDCIIRERAQDTQEDNKLKKSDGINFLTLHCSKGLEYKVVFIMDVCEGIIPYNKAVFEEEIEEERRMFYVAMTRAKEKLYLMYPKKRYNKDTTSSRFIDELTATTDSNSHLHPRINLHTP